MRAMASFRIFSASILLGLAACSGDTDAPGAYVLIEQDAGSVSCSILLRSGTAPDVTVPGTQCRYNAGTRQVSMNTAECGHLQFGVSRVGTFSHFCPPCIQAYKHAPSCPLPRGELDFYAVVER
ncbi:hypothetical protein NON20_23920 (plasmid) [Synechocystis sp. B12]|nr:hypothetical protein NON20_23920 [Synechocystis sp. B12]